jgi:hypothetical protein
MPGPDGERCSACYYYEPSEPDADEGVCCWWPTHPVAYVSDGEMGRIVHYESRYSRVKAHRWCGQFRERVVPARHAPADVLRGPIGEEEVSEPG